MAAGWCPLNYVALCVTVGVNSFVSESMCSVCECLMSYYHGDYVIKPLASRRSLCTKWPALPFSALE